MNQRMLYILRSMAAMRSDGIKSALSRDGRFILRYETDFLEHWRWDTPHESSYWAYSTEYDIWNREDVPVRYTRLCDVLYRYMENRKWAWCGRWQLSMLPDPISGEETITEADAWHMMCPRVPLSA